MRFAIIDGTGEFFDSTYHKNMSDSFCQQIARSLGLSPSGDANENHQCQYQRGPSTDGLSVYRRAHRAANWLARGDSPIYLAGYSRGGSAVIYAAELLEERGRDVSCLFLFDAVARHPFYYGRVVPGNVRFSVHMHRENTPEDIERYDNTINAKIGNPLRPWFGNTGLRSRGDGVHIRKGMKGSHAALGGPGWIAIPSDEADSQKVAEEMNRHFAAQRIPVKLRAKSSRF